MGKSIKFPDFDKTELTADSSPPIVDKIAAELFFRTNSYNFLQAQFVSSLLEEGSMWISGSVGISKQILWQVNVADFKVLLKKTIEDSKASSQIIMVSFGKQILFAEKGGSKIYGINDQTQSIETMFTDMNFQIDAMCCNDDHLYIFQKKHPDVIQILDSKLQLIGNIQTGLQENFSECEVDLCATTMRMSTLTQRHSSSEFKTKNKHICIISMSNPADLYQSSWYLSAWSAPRYPSVRCVLRCPFVRAVNEAGVIWQVDSKRCPEFDDRFNPCSVSMSATGDVFIADNGTGTVSKLVGMRHPLAQNNIFRMKQCN